MKYNKLTKQDLINIMDLHRNGVHQIEIAEKYKVSQGFISVLTKAYNGNKSQYLKLAESHRVIIDQLTESRYQQNKHCVYECKILWGLITLKFTPVTNN